MNPLQIGLNLGCGTRQYGLPRPIPNHNTACVICGVTTELHHNPPVDGGPMRPETMMPHKYVGYDLRPGGIAWVNLDANPACDPDIAVDWKSFLSLRPVDLIIANHTFEHQGCGEQPIRQCYDVLKPGGSLIVAVPDVRKLAKMWLAGELTTQIYLTNIYGPYDGTPESRHHWGFDETSLALALVVPGADWKQIKPFNWRAIPGAEIPRDDRWILAMEAVK